MLVSINPKKYIYDKSDKFKARSQFFFGTVLCTPLAMDLLYYLQHDADSMHKGIGIECLVGALGAWYLNNSHCIMRRRDEKNA